MIALALKVFGWLLTIEFGRVERVDDDHDEATEVVPARQFRIGFAAPDGVEDVDQDDEEDTGVKTW